MHDGNQFWQGRHGTNAKVDGPAVKLLRWQTLHGLPPVWRAGLLSVEAGEPPLEPHVLGLGLLEGSSLRGRRVEELFRDAVADHRQLRGLGAGRASPIVGQGRASRLWPGVFCPPCRHGHAGAAAVHHTLLRPAHPFRVELRANVLRHGEDISAQGQRVHPGVFVVQGLLPGLHEVGSHAVGGDEQYLGILHLTLGGCHGCED
mmetsp:Transcript_40405/g.129724  ORF Transcript_40405/g.129724 Transcript_40405/m.129724 type:complete len:203 (-) Transcript_40405:1362-1970(-)